MVVLVLQQRRRLEVVLSWITSKTEGDVDYCARHLAVREHGLMGVRTGVGAGALLQFAQGTFIACLNTEYT